MKLKTNDIKRKYKKEIISLFPSYGKYEKQYFYRFWNGVLEFIEDFPEIPYEGLIKEFCTPKEVVSGYFSSVSDQYLMQKIKRTKIIRNGMLGFLMILVIIVVYQATLSYHSYLDEKNEVISKEQIIIKEH